MNRLSRFQKVLCSFASVFAAAGCTPSPTPATHAADAGQVVGGTLVQSASSFASFTVSIENDLGDGSIATCTGVLISNDIVLTAAHCIQPQNNPSFQVFFGREDEVYKDVRNVSVYSVNPNYVAGSSGVDYDMALLKLSDLAPAGTTWLQIKNAPLNVGDQVSVLGFGLTTYDNSSQGDPVLLRYINLNVTDMNTTFNKITVGINATSGISHGDSGGPMVVFAGQAIQLVGVATDMASELAGGVPVQADYAWVASQLPWIQAQIPEMRAKAAAAAVAAAAAAALKN